MIGVPRAFLGMFLTCFHPWSGAFSAPPLAHAAVTPASPKHIFIVLSREDVSGENNEAAHSKRRVDADHYPHDPPLEDTCGK